jgi:5-methylcytosine-specific restriction endonuclease McrA
MEAHKIFKDADDFSSHLFGLREQRRRRKRQMDKMKQARRSLSSSHRAIIFAKTAGRCHICGEAIREGEPWDADHVFAHAQGGQHSLDNYLPAHSLCNNYRWFYSAEEFQWILKLGVWFRTQIIRRNPLALNLAERFVKYEIRRDQR